MKFVVLSTLLLASQVFAQYKAYGVANQVSCVQAAHHVAYLFAQESATQFCQSYGMRMVELGSRLLGESGEACWSGSGNAGAAIELSYTCIN
jgi:hypothetical protein